jgi:hypothetical protein
MMVLALAQGIDAELQVGIYHECYGRLRTVAAAIVQCSGVSGPEDICEEVFGHLRQACEGRGEKLTPSVLWYPLGRPAFA